MTLMRFYATYSNLFRLYQWCGLEILPFTFSGSVSSSSKPSPKGGSATPLKPKNVKRYSVVYTVLFDIYQFLSLFLRIFVGKSLENSTAILRQLV